MLVIAKLPHLHSIKVRYFPFFSSGKVKQRRKSNSVHQHSSADIREIKFLSVVCAKFCFGWICFLDDRFKIFEQFFFIVASEGFGFENHFSVFAVSKFANGNDDDLSELSINTSAFFK